MCFKVKVKFLMNTLSKLSFQDLFVFIICIHVSACMYVYITCVGLGPMETRKGPRISWNPSYK